MSRCESEPVLVASLQLDSQEGPDTISYLSALLSTKSCGQQCLTIMNSKKNKSVLYTPLQP